MSYSIPADTVRCVAGKGDDGRCSSKGAFGPFGSAIKPAETSFGRQRSFVSGSLEMGYDSE